MWLNKQQSGVLASCNHSIYIPFFFSIIFFTNIFFNVLINDYFHLSVIQPVFSIFISHFCFECLLCNNTINRTQQSIIDCNNRQHVNDLSKTGNTKSSQKDIEFLMLQQQKAVKLVDLKEINLRCKNSWVGFH